MAAFEAALDVFRGLGASVRPVTLPPIEQFDDAKKIIAISELFTIHAADLRTRPELFGASLRYRIIAGGLVRAEDYIQAMRLRTELARSLQAVLATVDLLMLPTSEPARKLEPVPPVHPVHAAVAHRGVQCRRQSRPVGVQRLRRRAACRSRCRSSAACSTRPRCCAPATPTKRRRHGATSVRCFSAERDPRLAPP